MSFFAVPLQHVVEILNGGNRGHPVEGVELRRGHLREPPSADQPFLNQFPKRERHLIHQHLEIHAVQVIEIHVIRPQVLERLREVLLQNRVDRVTGFIGGSPEVDLRRENHFIPDTLERLPEDLLVVAPVVKLFAVRFRRVKKRASEIKCRPDRAHRVRLIRNPSEAVRKRHAAHANRRHFNFSEESVFHWFSFVRAFRPLTSVILRVKSDRFHRAQKSCRRGTRRK